MADGHEPSFSEADAIESTEFEPNTSDDIEMAENDYPIDLSESMLDEPTSEAALSEVDVNYTTDVEPVLSHEPAPVESARPLDLGESSLGKPKSKKALSETNDHELTDAELIASNDASPVESAHEVVHETSFADLADQLTEAAVIPTVEVSSTESTAPIDLGQSILGKPKSALNLGTSSLSKPASQTQKEKAKAMQARLAKQFAAKTAEKIVSAPTDVLSQPDGEGRAASVQSGVFVPAVFGESVGDSDAETAEFEVLKAAYALKKAAGTTDIASDIAFLRAEAQEKARLQKLAIDARYDRDGSDEEEDNESALFVTPQGRTPASHAFASASGGETPNQAFFTDNPRKGKRKAVDNSMAPPSKKRNQSTKQPTGRSLGNRKGGKGLSSEEIDQSIHAMGRNAKQSASKKKKPDARKPSHNISNVDSMLGGTDVFRDANAVAGLSNQPAFKAGVTHRQAALRGLIASVPQDDQSVASGDKKLLENALKDFDGQGSCKPSADGSGWTLRGMKCTLKHYQVLGIAFMRKRENQEFHPRGGILADEMGLGKTIQMIANIINGKPKDDKVKTTLIVASPALISQWHDEIHKFAQTKKESPKHGIKRIIQHRAGYKQGGSHDDVKKAIMESDICLTTYTEVMKSYPKNNVPPECTTERSKAAWWKQYFEDNKGVFHDMKFLRVVLDEAQMIKNHTGQASMACRALKSEYSWAISGTPLVNGIREMYPYLKFLKHPHAGSMRTFEANFCSPNDPTGSEKLGVFLKQIIIRRTHKDLLFGARLLDLPTPKQNVMYLEFNGVERTIYEIVKTRFIQRINTITKNVQGKSTQYSHIWTMLLRLRQICSHVLLIQHTIMDLLEREDFEKLNEITQQVEGESQDNSEMLAHLSHTLVAHRASLAAAQEAADASVAGADVNVVPGSATNTGPFEPDLGGKHGKTYGFGKLLASASRTEQMKVIDARAKCCACRLLPDTPYTTSCHHIYCKACLIGLGHASARSQQSGARCLECGTHFKESWPTKGFNHNDTSDTEASRSSPDSSQVKNKKKNKKKNDDELDWISQEREVLPSAKTVACKAQIIDWLAEKPDCKIIVYTQFLPMIRIMGRVCEAERWKYLKYSGIMSHSAREKALRDFASDANVRVLLMSLKCGGLGLNIVAASRVILIDPWWNDAVEQQAFCRVFRIGQTNETRLARLCIKNSIDAAMFSVKERKTAEIEKVMDNTKSPRTVRELMELFGNVDEDEDGHPFIFPDEDDNADEAVPRYYEPEDRSHLFGGGPAQPHMGNDI